MSVRDLLDEVARHGGRLTPRGDKLHIDAPEPLPDVLMDRLREHKPELLRLLADPARPCPTCGCGSFWRDQSGTWHCEQCTPPGDQHVRTWRNVAGAKVPPTPPPAVAWPADLDGLLRRIATCFEWSAEDRKDFIQWARRSPGGLKDARVFLQAECDKLDIRLAKGGRLSA